MMCSTSIMYLHVVLFLLSRSPYLMLMAKTSIIEKFGNTRVPIDQIKDL